MRTIAVVNQKGGCGKTTVSINLASALAQLGKKVLLVDMDPQAHCAVGLAVPEEQIEQSIYDVLISHSRNEPIRLSEILWQISDRLELAPASLDLSAFEQQMSGVAEREMCLKNVIDEVTDTYDFAVIDCPPAVGLLTFNALRAATDVLVPVETGYFALHGLSKQLETLGILCKRCKQQVNVRVLASMYDIRTKMAREILAELRTHFADRMLKTVVNFNTKIKEAASFGQPINEYDPASKGQQDFHRLAQEIIGIESIQDNRQIINSLADQLDAISTTANELLATSKASQPQDRQRTATAEVKAVAQRQPVAPASVEQPGQPVPERQTAVAPVESAPVELASVAVAAPASQGTTSVSAAQGPSGTAKETLAPIVTAETKSQTQRQAAQSRVEPARPAVSELSTAGKEVHSPASADVKPAVKMEIRAIGQESRPQDTEAKLASYYGTQQTPDAVTFVTLYPRATTVEIAGDFNNWQPQLNPMQRVGDSGVWQTQISLSEGHYRYRYVVDGHWQQDPYNENTEMNPYGEYNSVLEVK